VESDRRHILESLFQIEDDEDDDPLRFPRWETCQRSC